MFRTINVFLLTLLFVSFATKSIKAQEAANEKQIIAFCSDTYFSQADLLNCVSKKASESSAKLNKAEKEVSRKISAWDEQNSFITGALKKLTQSKDAYLTYRQKQCAFGASLAGGAAGNTHEIRRLACEYELNLVQEHLIQRMTENLKAK